MNILLIEDDITLNGTITDYLRFKGNDIVSLDDGNKAIDTIDEIDFDLYIIDINIPNISGLEIVKYIRQKETKIPIIIITASMELENFKIAYQNGCDEYIKKPFYLEELEIRIDKLLSKKSQKDSLIQISDNITFDMEYEELNIYGEIKRLRKKEKRLLSLLLQNINKTVSIEIIENYVWENEIKESYPIRQLVNDLRKEFDNGEKFIFLDRGVGYRFEIKN
jgi:two-component system OmpR family response regulator